MFIVKYIIACIISLPLSTEFIFRILSKTKWSRISVSKKTNIILDAIMLIIIIVVNSVFNIEKVPIICGVFTGIIYSVKDNIVIFEKVK